MCIRDSAWPVVSWKPPILSLRGERVGRRASLHVRVEKFRRLPHVRTVPMHADGDVAFYHEAALMRVRRRAAQLQMQVILNEIVKGNFVVILRKHGNFLCVKFLISGHWLKSTVPNLSRK